MGHLEDGQSRARVIGIQVGGDMHPDCAKSLLAIVWPMVRRAVCTQDVLMYK